MTVTRKKLTGTTVLLGLAAALLGGCAGKTAQDFNPLIVGQWRQVPTRPDVRVESVQLEHIVAFQQNAIRLDNTERERMAQFIQDGRLNIRDRILLSAPRSEDGAYDSVTAARLDVLRGEFQKMGLVADVAQTSRAGGGGDQVAIVVQRTALLPPDCSAPEEPWAGQRPHYEVGCAYNAALGMMVADPHDLAKGRPMASPDGEVAASAIQRYRKEKLTEKREFIKEGTD
ncbi:MAG: CpaD family pilus assembly protein [Rhodospirillales bacterium]|nr:CpaD family pilus assembly protein [Rhodospirillales bacterium]MDH3967192.1 CpaD family pilus assembly protein [Rhodospirillales bacterium]